MGGKGEGGHSAELCKHLLKAHVLSTCSDGKEPEGSVQW